MFAKRFIIDLWKGLLYASRNFTTYTILRNYCKNVTSIPSLTWTLALHCYLLFFLGWKEMWDALRDLVPFVQFKKRENYLWRRATFSKSWNVTKSNTPPWEFFAFFKLYKWYHLYHNSLEPIKHIKIVFQWLTLIMHLTLTQRLLLGTSEIEFFCKNNAWH